MARGIANNEPVVSQAQTRAYDAGYDRIGRTPRAGERGRFVYDATLGRCVPLGEYRAQDLARNAPVMVDRFMENVRTTDGIDIGSRGKRRDYMRAAGVADCSDYGLDYAQRVRSSHERTEEKHREGVVAEAFGRAAEMRQADYDGAARRAREVRERRARIFQEHE